MADDPALLELLFARDPECESFPDPDAPTDATDTDADFPRPPTSDQFPCADPSLSDNYYYCPEEHRAGGVSGETASCVDLDGSEVGPTRLPDPAPMQLQRSLSHAPADPPPSDGVVSATDCAAARESALRPPSHGVIARPLVKVQVVHIKNTKIQTMMMIISAPLRVPVYYLGVVNVGVVTSCDHVRGKEISVCCFW